MGDILLILFIACMIPIAVTIILYKMGKRKKWMITKVFTILLVIVVIVFSIWFFIQWTKGENDLIVWDLLLYLIGYAYILAVGIPVAMLIDTIIYKVRNLQ